MSNTKPNNVDELQEQYIKAVLKVPVNNRNYGKSVSAQSRKFMDTLLGLGYSQTDAEAYLYEAHAAVKMERLMLAGPSEIREGV